MGTYVSLHGRQIGFDSFTGSLQRPGFSENFDDEEAISAASTATNIKWRGVSTITTTAAKAYTLNAPPFASLGCVKVIASNSTSTAGASTVTLASGNFISTAGSSFTKLNWAVGGPANVTLQALSTALVLVTGNVGGITLTT